MKFTSRGEWQGAVAYLKADLSLNSGINVFSDGVVGCDGIGLGGSGRIDSYDSREGAYDRNNFNQNGSVATYNANSDIALSGDSPIYGNITVNGDFSSTGSSPLIGNVNAKGDVNISGGSSGMASDRVTGDINSGGNMTLSSSISIGGDVQVANNVSYGSGSTIGGSLTYNGNLTGPRGTDDHSGFAASLHKQEPTLPEIPAKACDPIDIKTQMASLVSAPSNGKLDTSHWAYDDFAITPGSAQMMNGSDQVSVDSQTLEVFGEDAQVHVFDSLNLKNGKINISGGDVVIVVKGDFVTGGNPSNMTVADGSSVTIFVQGKTSVGSGSFVAADGSVTGTGKAPVSLFSSYESKNDRDTGVKLSGASDTYSAVYAPLSHVDVAASGDLMGSIRGKTVDITGAGGMHYDEALGSVEHPSTDKNARFNSLQYYYPQ